MHPFCSTAKRVTGKFPVLEYTCCVVTPVPAEPSPKFQFHWAKFPEILIPLKFTREFLHASEKFKSIMGFGSI